MRWQHWAVFHGTGHVVAHQGCIWARKHKPVASASRMLVWMSTSCLNGFQVPSNVGQRAAVSNRTQREENMFLFVGREVRTTSSVCCHRRRAKPQGH